MPMDFDTGSGRMPLYFSPGLTAVRKILTYETVFGLTEASAGAGAFTSFRLNSIYDPDYTGVGISALGYSTYALLYSRYRVIRCRIFLRAVASTGVAGGAQTVGFIPTANSTFTSNPLNWAAQPLAKSKVLMALNAGSRVMTTMDYQIPLHRVAGVTRQQYLIDQDYGATFGANPVSNLFLHVFLHGKLSSTAEVGRFELRLVYDVELSQPLASITA